MSDAVEKVRQALEALNYEGAVIESCDTIFTVEDASKAIGVTPGEILKSLIFIVDNRPWLVLMSGANKVHSGSVKRATGGKKVSMAAADWVFETFGFHVGGVPPVGYAEELPALLDDDLFRYEQVWAAAGTDHAFFPIEPERLQAFVRGRRAAVKKVEISL